MKLIKSHQMVKKTKDGRLFYIYVEEFATMYEVIIQRGGRLYLEC